MQATSYVKEFRLSHLWQLETAYLPDGGAYLINEGYLPRRGHFIAHWLRLTLAITANVGNSTVQFLVVGICVRAHPLPYPIKELQHTYNVYTCMYICYVYMWGNGMFVQACLCMRIHMYMHAYMYACVYPCMNECIYAYLYMYINSCN